MASPQHDEEEGDRPRSDDGPIEIGDDSGEEEGDRRVEEVGGNDCEEDPGPTEESWKDDDFLSFGGGGGGGGGRDEGDGEDGGVGEDVDEGARQGQYFSRDYRDDPYRHDAAALPPWMEDYHRTSGGRGRITPPLVLLHNEIVDFARLMEPRDDEVREREEIIDKVRKLALDTFGKDKCEVMVFGSQATGLFLPTSDIDLVIHLPEEEGKESDDNNGKKEAKESDRAKDQREMEEWNLESAGGSSKSSPLLRLGDALRRHWLDDLTYLEVVEATRVPIVKFTLKAHSPSGTASGTGGISVDICFNQTTGAHSAQLVRTFMTSMPPLRPLTFVLKYFMAARGLNEPYTGGIGSFLLQMMIVSFLQHREREEFKAGRGQSVLNLGSLLLEFFELYGVDFNYATTGISVRNDGEYFAKGAKERREHFWQPTRPFSLALENPFEIEADVGRPSYRMQLIQKSFEVAFRTVLAHTSEPPVPAVSILASILPPTEEMRRRATLRKVDAIERGLQASGYNIVRPIQGKGKGERGHTNDGSDMDESEEEGQEGPTQKRSRVR